MKVACPICGGETRALGGEWALVHGDDLPGHGSRTEIMISPSRLLRVVAWICADQDCPGLVFGARDKAEPQD